MATKIPITFFAPAEREPVEVVRRKAGRLGQSPLTQTFLNGALNYLFVLNRRRQIVMASENVSELIPGKTIGQIIGLRPGEALGCVHAHECQSGCGTSQLCRHCGAVRVILAGLAGYRHVQECNMRCLSNGREATLSLRVLATPLVYEEEHYTLLAVEKVSYQQAALTHHQPEAARVEARAQA